MTLTEGYGLEVVRGARSPALDDELIRFWTDRKALAEPVARARLGHVVCVLRGPDGAIAAVNSVFDEVVPEIGGRRFWVYRTLTPTAEGREALDEMVAATRERLQSELSGRRGEPIGICLRVTDRETIERRNRPVWPISELMFAGYTESGRQLRVVYFDGAKVI